MLASANGKAAAVAGGTDFMVQIREKAEKWADLRYAVDLTHIPELDGIYKDGELIRIGALTSHAHIADNAMLQKEAAFLCRACASVGSPQIRNRGSIGGNVANASPAADPISVLVALDAEITVVSSRGERTAPIASIYCGPYMTNLGKDEIITEIRFHALPAGTRTAFVKLGRRKALAISRMNVAAALIMDGCGGVEAARICPGCIFPAPCRVPEAEVLIKGAVTGEMAAAAGKKASEVMIAKTGVRWSTEYKQPVAESLVKRAIMQAFEEV